MDNFIDQLTCTLNAANLPKLENDIEEDLKDEILEDLEEEVIQAESRALSNQNNSQLTGEKRNNSHINLKNVNQSDDEDIIMVKKDISNSDYGIKNYQGDSKISGNQRNKVGKSYDIPDYNNLGATNHMQSRINSLEKYFIRFESFLFLLRLHL
jgi:hypothetical protein